ncbi:ABC transporter ATP-binding protein [Streptococcus massiliensis]|uniref:ABC transporter ATP-binding protein/permease n=1 Tax=Streptococcus massiliensis TaxID=313439 RepID=A0A380L0C3_9STRE|nr:ABC transporter ATP-binding protein [Streptococcus massiliensis]SUN76646.1 ABC transporter ATP-binding protein/permease [Streptococcus massiliensis]
MKEKLQALFALTDKGAENLLKSCWVSLALFFGQMLPFFLLMFYIENLLSGTVPNLWALSAALVAVVLVLYGLLYTDYNATYTTTYQESANIRLDIAGILQKLPLSYFSNHDLSDLSQTLMSDVERLEHALSHAIAKTIAFVVYFILMAVLMLLGNVYLGLSVLLPILLTMGLLLLSKKMQLDMTTKYWQQLRENSESFQSAIELQEELKAYNLHHKFAQNLRDQMEKSEKLHLKSELTQGIPLMLANILIRFTLGIVVLVSSILYLQGQVPLLYVLGYLLVAVKMMDALEGLTANITELLHIDVAVKQIKSLRETPQQKGKSVELKHFDIVLEDVSFAYKEDQKVIDHVSFTAKQNQVTALVGPSGCGKTTLLRLLSRLYDYDSGHILIDGYDIRDLDTDSLFSAISIVFQEVTLFNDTVLENIRLGRPSASDEEVKEAARLARCEDFIARLPEGYDTLIGENGAKLSGGERQRISIARAMLKQAPIVILDEIASSLDIENEKMIQESLNLLLKDKTVIIISHRLKSIENADQIVVMKDGQVEGIGKHQELLTSSGVYQELVATAEKIDKFRYRA